ncbi:hypothetical protein H1P_4810002 [Hyella patelloides LEGE 07179]|uniref:UvrD-like helicase C-terminal domain-containing protein n=1 Tax=Hyella patelloides LEGE 07179 TaxID=945734 RepID=A0A563VZ07_9CYAN|nr:ATP-binding domain-containing protein [Hyella patelloides]VEP16684.1 hypothetical protein H1P_4810002 [Hyella patelloides LEGE 07179]
MVYDYADLNEITLAWATSIHKSQGSEYPVVILPLYTQHYVMLSRNLFYTGLTRAKKSEKAIAITQWQASPDRCKAGQAAAEIYQVKGAVRKYESVT